MSVYASIRQACIANGYAAQDAARIAKRYAYRRNALAAFNRDYSA